MKNIFVLSILFLTSMLTVATVSAQSTPSLKTAGYHDEKQLAVQQVPSTDIYTRAPSTETPTVVGPVTGIISTRTNSTRTNSTRTKLQNCETASLKTINYCHPGNTRLPVAHLKSNVGTLPQGEEDELKSNVGALPQEEDELKSNVGTLPQREEDELKSNVGTLPQGEEDELKSNVGTLPQEEEDELKSNVGTLPQGEEDENLPRLEATNAPLAAPLLKDPSDSPLTLVEPTPSSISQEPNEASIFSGMRFFASGEGGLSLPSLNGRSSHVRWANTNNDVLTLDKETTSWNPTGSYDLGYHLGLRAGAMLNNGFYAAIDGIYRYQSLQNSWTNTVNSIDHTSEVNTNIDTVATFLTGGFILSDMGIFRPFGEVSIGYALNTASAIAYSKTGANTRTETTRYGKSEAAHIAFGASIGSGIMLTNNVEARLGYRYRNFGVADTGSGFESGYTHTRVLINTLDAHELFAGVSFYF